MGEIASTNHSTVAAGEFRAALQGQHRPFQPHNLCYVDIYAYLHVLVTKSIFETLSHSFCKIHTPKEIFAEVKSDYRGSNSGSHPFDNRG